MIAAFSVSVSQTKDWFLLILLIMIIKAILLIRHIWFANLSTHAIAFCAISFGKRVPLQKFSKHCYHCKTSSGCQLLFEYQSRSYLTCVNHTTVISFEIFAKTSVPPCNTNFCFSELLFQNNSYIFVWTFASLLSSPIQVENKCNFLDAYAYFGLVSTMSIHSHMETTIFFPNITF